MCDHIWYRLPHSRGLREVGLAAALRSLDARIYTDAVPEGLSFDCSARMLECADMWNLVTNAGRIDIAFKSSGTQGFEDLDRDANHFIVFGVDLAVASLPDIVRSKEASGRPKDADDVLLLREILDRAMKA